MVASDASPKMIDLATARAAAEGLNIEFHVTDATDGALRALGEASFDAVVWAWPSWTFRTLSRSCERYPHC